MRQNRFEAMGAWAKAVLVGVFALAFVAVLEVGALVAGMLFLPDPVAQRFADTFHPLMSGRPVIPAERERLTGGLYGGSNQYDPWLGHRPLIESQWVNRSGFLHDGKPERDLRTKDEDVFRIFVLGGSTVAGYDIPESKTISAQLEATLNGRGLPLQFEVVNAGVQGYYSPQELALFTFEIAYLDPDMVIAFDGYNDLDAVAVRTDEADQPVEGDTEHSLFDRAIEDYERYHWSSYHRYLYSLIQTDGDSDSFSLRIPEAWQPWRYFYLPALVMELMTRPSGPQRLFRGEPDDIPALIAERYPGLTPEAFKPVRNTLWHDPGFFEKWRTAEVLHELPGRDTLDDRVIHYSNNLAAMDGVADRLGIRFIAVLQPLLLPGSKRFTVAERFWSDAKANHWALRFGHDYRGMMADQVAKVRARLDTLIGDEFVDFTEVFTETEETAYVDWVHYSVPGIRIITEALADQVLRRIDVVGRP